MVFGFGFEIGFIWIVHGRIIAQLLKAFLSSFLSIRDSRYAFSSTSYFTG